MYKATRHNNLNSNWEYRNSKQIQNSNFQIPKPKECLHTKLFCLEFMSLVIRYCFRFRASGLDFICISANFNSSFNEAYLFTPSWLCYGYLALFCEPADTLIKERLLHPQQRSQPAEHHLSICIETNPDNVCRYFYFCCKFHIRSPYSKIIISLCLNAFNSGCTVKGEGIKASAPIWEGILE